MTKFVVDNGKNLIQAYDAAETDALLNQKANAADVYDKTEIDAKDYDLEQRIAAVDVKFADYYPQFAIDMMLDGKANTSGEYDDITAGHAKQLTSRVGEIDKTPYNFRTSGGSLDIGDLETDKIIGGSVAWNQLQTSKTGSARTAQFAPMFGVNWDYTVTIGHVYFVSFLQPSGCSVYRQNCKNFPCGYRTYDAPTTPTTVSFITKSTENEVSAGVGERLISKNETTETEYSLDNLQFFDLTQMFGSTIADYIYSLESANAGAGVAWFRKLFPKSYYSYNAGQIISVKTSKHVTVGFNAFDYETGKAQLLGGVEYQITGAYTAISYTDINGNAETITPDSDGIFTPTNNGEMTVTGGDNLTTCIHIVWDGERNGEYEPYVTNEYYLQNDLELRGIFKLDANNKLYADGDEYPDSGEVTRKYGIVDLGSLDWNEVEQRFNTISALPNAKSGNFIECICSIYETRNDVLQRVAPFSICIANNGYCYVYDTRFNDAAAFKTAMSGVYLVYELETPTSESVNGYTNPQKVDDFGTEQYVDGREVEIPVGHETFYVANLKAKLEMSPDSPDADGLYLMQHNNGENVYIPYISPIPTPPTTDGTYILKAVVSSGVATLQWIEETT